MSEVIVAGWLAYEPGDRDFVLDEMNLVARESREEPGCIDYSVNADLDEPGRIRVFEYWDSPQSLTHHLTLPHVMKFRDAIEGRKRTGRSLLLHEVASSEPMQSESQQT